jgi:hypothetical protein
MRNWALASMALAFVSLACGSGGSSGNGGSSGGGGTSGKGGKEGGSEGGSPIEVACSTFATALCAQINTCSKIAIQRDYGMMETCVEAQTQLCTNELSASSTGATPADRSACASALSASSWTCTDFLNNVNPPSACAPVKGTVASGGGCAFASQCATGFCAIEPKAACGTCETTPAVGDACGKLLDCGQGLVCSTNNKCVAPGASGAMCGPDDPCLVGLSCVGSKPKLKKPVLGTCQESVTTMGGACDVTQKTAPACSVTDGLICNSTSKMCETLALAAPGGACGNSTGQLIICSDGASCSATAGDGGTSGTCTATIPDKGSCQRTPGTGPCDTGERCIVVGDSGTSGTCEFNGSSSCM